MAKTAIRYENYQEQRTRWPGDGRHILAQYDDESIIVYQAYRPENGRHADAHQHYGGPWSFDRMSWIKPNFLWMMYRSGWAEKAGQEVVLAIRISRDGFDQILARAVHSSFKPGVYESRAAWQGRVAGSDVRLQWDPDHDPHGNKVERRAIQLGLRGPVLRRYARDWCLGIEDISGYVCAQREHVIHRRLDLLETPAERVYPVADPAVRQHLGLAAWPG